MTTRFTRRRAVALLLSGATLPASKALAADPPGGPADPMLGPVSVRVRPDEAQTPVVLTTCSGESFTATLTSDLVLGSRGGALGFLRLEFGDRDLRYAAERGGLDFDGTGAVVRAWALLREQGGSGHVAQDFALLSVAPEVSGGEDCLIYTTTGTQISGPEAVTFDVPGLFQVRTRASRR